MFRLCLIYRISHQTRPDAFAAYRRMYRDIENMALIGDEPSAKVASENLARTIAHYGYQGSRERQSQFPHKTIESPGIGEGEPLYLHHLR